MRLLDKLLLPLLCAAVMGVTAGGFAAVVEARDQIMITGSSTVYPFVTVAGEKFRNKTSHKAPVVELMGTGGGMKEFCAGVGVAYPDIANASRRIKKSELALCKKNGVTAITEVFIGYDGIVLAHSAQAEKPFSISVDKLFLALARRVPVDGSIVDNPYKKWSDIDGSLPDFPILVYGPPPTSGTRDAFVEKVMQHSCIDLPEFVAAYADKKDRKRECGLMREDGAFVEIGENDNVIIQKIRANPQALGILGFGFVEENQNIVRGSLINGVAPTFESIQDKSYPIWRTMYVYVKNAHVDMVPGVKEFLLELTSDEAMDQDDGYLVDKGLVPPGREDLQKSRENINTLRSLEF